MAGIVFVQTSNFLKVFTCYNIVEWFKLEIDLFGVEPIIDFCQHPLPINHVSCAAICACLC